MIDQATSLYDAKVECKWPVRSFLFVSCVTSCLVEQAKNRAYFSLCIRVRRSRDSCSFLATCQRNSSTVPFLGNFNSKVEPVVAFTSTVMISSILLLSFFLRFFISLFFFISQDDLSLKMGVVCVCSTRFSRLEQRNVKHKPCSPLSLCV